MKIEFVVKFLVQRTNLYSVVSTLCLHTQWRCSHQVSSASPSPSTYAIRRRIECVFVSRQHSDGKYWRNQNNVGTRPPGLRAQSHQAPCALDPAAGGRTVKTAYTETPLRILICPVHWHMHTSVCLFTTKHIILHICVHTRPLCAAFCTYHLFTPFWRMCARHEFSALTSSTTRVSLCWQRFRGRLLLALNQDFHF